MARIDRGELEPMTISGTREAQPREGDSAQGAPVYDGGVVHWDEIWPRVPQFLRLANEALNRLDAAEQKGDTEPGREADSKKDD